MRVNSEPRYQLNEIPNVFRILADLRFVQPVFVEIGVELTCERKLLPEFR